MSREGQSYVPSANPTHLVEARDVVKVFESKTRRTLAVDRISFNIREGEFVSLLGPSGCGKSTMLKLIAGLEPATSGTIAVEGRPVSRPVTNLGIVFQDPVLLEWRDVIDNVMIQIDVRGLDRARYLDHAKALLAQVSLTDFVRSYPFELSGGMRQRVSIVRSLVHNPPLLLMDEPFSALDALTRDSMNVLLHDLWRTHHKTVLFITHSLADAVFLSQRVMVMSPRPGRIVAELPIDLPAERTLALRESPDFTRHTGRLREIFEGLGVL